MSVGLAVVSITTLCIAVVGCTSAKRDFKELCDAAEDVARKNDLSVEEQQRLLQRWLERRTRSSKFELAAAALGAMAPNRRYAVMQQTARESGDPGWRCEALKGLLDSPLWCDFDFTSPVPVLRLEARRLRLDDRVVAGVGPSFWKREGSPCSREHPPLRKALGESSGLHRARLAVVVGASTPYRELCMVLKTARAAGFRTFRLSAADKPREVRRMTYPRRGRFASRPPGLGVAVLESRLTILGSGGMIHVGCDDPKDGSCAGRAPGADPHDLRRFTAVTRDVLAKYGKGRVWPTVADASVPARKVIRALGVVDDADPAGAVDRFGVPATRMVLTDVKTFESHIGEALRIRRVRGRLVPAYEEGRVPLATVLRPPERAPRAVVKRKAPDIDGTMKINAVNQTVRRGMAAVRSCYQRALRREPGLSGHLTVLISINTTGRVTGVEVQDDTLGDPQVASCVKGFVRRWRFPPPEGSAEVAQSFLFRPLR
jgi:TonB family protein